MGAQAISLPSEEKLPLAPIKGQLVILENDIQPACPIASQQLVLPFPDDAKKVLLGATYELAFSDEKAHLNQALDMLLPKAAQFFPPISQAAPLSAWAGIRVSAAGHKPFIKQLHKRCYLFTGLGSKGMLWHSYLAKNLVDMLLP